MAGPASSVRILLLADTHLGFDLPAQPRVRRRRRGFDFQANLELALAPARAGRVDLVIHGGDLFHRARVSPSLAFQGLRPLLQVAEAGIPVFLVPGNHERSRIPHIRFASHPNLRIFHRPETVPLFVRGIRMAISGFPFQRGRIRDDFPKVLENTGWDRWAADVRLLCMHQCVEGATVGPSDYTFRNTPDVIRRGDLPQEFTAVVSGHIHRHQVLVTSGPGREGTPPVFYPGSVERTAFAEAGEDKGFVLLTVQQDGARGQAVSHRFVRLPARPMVVEELLPPQGPRAPWTRPEIEARIGQAVKEAPPDAVLRIRIHGPVPEDVAPSVAACRLRRLASPFMNLEVRIVDAPGMNAGERRRHGDGASRGKHSGPKDRVDPNQLRIAL